MLCAIYSFNYYSLCYNFFKSARGVIEMFPFIGRESELKRMEEDFSSNGSNLYIIYGRRRVGKTTLLQKFIENKKAIYFLATEESEESNLKQFQEVAYEKTKLGVLRPENRLSWYDIFDLISSGDQKMVIVMDEYQYLVTGNKSISSIIQKIWDEILSKRKVMLILCGSIINMMYAETLNYTSPLYGRRTSQINLKPLNFENYKSFFENKNIEEVIEFYSVTGGVPKYVEIFDRESTLEENVSKHIFDKNGFLYEEPYFLLGKEFKEIGMYFSILKTISNGSHKLSEIASKMEVGQNSLGYYLNVLAQMDLLYRDVPVTETNPEKSKKGLYFLKDNFISFWFKFVYPNRSFLEIGNIVYVVQKFKDEFTKYVSLVYEELARQNTTALASQGYFDHEILKVGRWWNGDDEIDIVGIDKSGKPNLFGECKYTNKVVDIKVLSDLLKKVEKNFDLISKPEFLIYSKSSFSQELIDYARDNKNVHLFKIFDSIY